MSCEMYSTASPSLRDNSSSSSSTPACTDTSSAEVTDFPGRRFRVDEVLPFGRQLSRVMARTVPQANIAVRNFPLSPDALRARLRIADGGDVYLFATTLADGRRVVIRCTRIG